MHLAAYPNSAPTWTVADLSKPANMEQIRKNHVIGGHRMSKESSSFPVDWFVIDSPGFPSFLHLFLF